MIKSVYTAIRDQLKGKLTYLQFVDLQKGQFDKPKENYPLPLPAALIGFSPMKWDTTSKGVKTGDMLINVYLYLDLSANSFEGCEQEAETLTMFDRLDDVYQVLEDLSGDAFAGLVKTGDAISKYGDRWVCFKIDFTSRVAAQRKNNLTVVLSTSLNETKA